MEAIINISSSLSLTIGILKFNVAGELKFNDGSESWHDDVILVRQGFNRLICIGIFDG